MSKTKSHLNYLRTCKREKLTPAFVQFKIPSTHHQYQRAINNCYEQILIEEIKYKKSELSRLYSRRLRDLKPMVGLDLSHFFVCRVDGIINQLVSRKETLISLTSVKKLDKLRDKHLKMTPPCKLKILLCR